MAGGVSKTLGTIATGLGSVVLLVGLFIAVANLDELGDESRKFVPNEGRLASAAAMALGGLAATALGLLLLFVGIPLLVYGLHRYVDPQTGHAATRRGGAMKAWGLAFVILGAIMLAVGAFAATYGAGIVEEELGRTIPHEPRGEAGAYLAVGGLVLLAGGILLSILGVPFLVAGASRATREAAASPPPAPAQAPWSAGRTALTLVVAFAMLGLMLGVAFGQGPGKGAFALLSDGEIGPDGQQAQVVEAPFEGTVRGAHAPALGEVGTGEERVEHVVAPQSVRGTVEVVGGWEAVAGPLPSLVVVIEAMGESGEWHELARVASEEDIMLTTQVAPLPGDVRVTIMLPEGAGGEARYAILVRIVPA